jgi:hypothetical protein
VGWGACVLAAALGGILGRRRRHHQKDLGSDLSRKCESGDSEVGVDYRDEDVYSAYCESQITPKVQRKSMRLKNPTQLILTTQRGLRFIIFGEFSIKIIA